MPIKREIVIGLSACLFAALLLVPAAVQPAHAQDAEPAQATQAGATDTARQAASANRLIVSARQAWNRAQEAEGEARQAALREALDHLQAVLRQHPDSDHAVTLVGGHEVAGISIPMIEQALAQAAQAVAKPAAVAEQHARAEDDVQQLRQAAEAGDAKAMFSLGVRYANGRGVAADQREAVRWYRQAADEGHATAMLNLGLRYANGRGVAKDDGQAVHWYRQAAEQGNARAMRYLGTRYQAGRGVEKNLHTAAEWYEKAVNAGSLPAMSGLGWMYKHGYGGKSKNLTEAVRLFRAAADKGDGSGLHNLAIMYEDGLGVAKDRREAVRLYRRAALAGDRRAQRHLNELNVSVYDPREIQRSLAALGYDPGAVDGKIGSRTRDAIRAFQRENDLAESGEPSLELVRQIAARQDAAGLAAAGAAAVAPAGSSGAADSSAAAAPAESGEAEVTPPPPDIPDLNDLEFGDF